MADRTLVRYLEERNEHGPFWTLEVERSSAGAPGGLVTIAFRSFDGSLPESQMTVVMDDLRHLQPALDWATNGPQASEKATLLVDALAADIRTADGSHRLGAGALAEALIKQGWRR